MKIALVHPHSPVYHQDREIQNRISFITEIETVPNLALLSLAALMPSKAQIEFIDEDYLALHDLPPDYLENDYDLVLMDILMPHMDGLQAASAIRRIPERAALPIVALTASTVEGDRRRCFDAGMNDFIAKSTMARLLYPVLARWLSHERQVLAQTATTRG